ncbi:hypothetical protein GCM10010327_62230 [Streptomyces nitrosporeus]|nr:hypothetical protein GCM10010327_62230 [Streptomyces nitrosporeus]
MRGRELLARFTPNHLAREVWRCSADGEVPTGSVITMTLDLSRLDQEDLSTLTDILPGMLWRTPPGSERHAWADTLM